MDAWGKIPSGMLSGNIIELGNFDQCIAVKHKLGPQPDDDTFEGQYCLGLINMPMPNNTAANFRNNFMRSDDVGQDAIGVRMPVMPYP